LAHAQSIDEITRPLQLSEHSQLSDDVALLFLKREDLP